MISCSTTSPATICRSKQQEKPSKCRRSQRILENMEEGTNTLRRSVSSTKLTSPPMYQSSMWWLISGFHFDSKSSKVSRTSSSRTILRSWFKLTHNGLRTRMSMKNALCRFTQFSTNKDSNLDTKFPSSSTDSIVFQEKISKTKHSPNL
jgi:hypothetical protein